MASTRKWHRTIDDTSYTISTDPSDLSHDFIQQAFASDLMYWAKPITAEQLQVMLANSTTFALFATSSSGRARKHAGIARLITDHVTFAWLTDVFVDPAYQGKGLGKWLVQCIKERVEEIPELRRIVLLTGGGGRGAQGLYEKEMGMSVLDPADGKAVAMEATKLVLQSVDRKGSNS